MCGIAGTYGINNEKIIRAMTQALAHRGPDGQATVLTGRHALGAARLALVGGEEAKIPFFDVAKNIHVLLNGEIYNFNYLREKLLKLGFTFKTEGEPEVISALYQRYGRFFARNLEGMFAIAILDGNRLLLARDRMGIKPLFYFVTGDKLTFASEIKSLLQFPGLIPALNRVALEETMVFGFIYSPARTLFQNVVQVEPGEIVEFADGILSKEKYALPPGNQPVANNIKNVNGMRSGDYQDNVQTLTKIFLQVMEQMWSHGRDEKGIYLSGGLDSTLEVLLAKEVSDGPVNTFTLSDSPEYADYQCAALVARSAGTRHHEFLVGEEDYWNELPHLVVHYENLVAGGVFDIHGALAFHILSRRVAKHVRIAFSGEGADELFGGYRWLHTHPLGFSDRLRERLNKIETGSRLKGLVHDLFPFPEDEELYRINIFNFLLSSGLASYHLWSVDRSSSAFGFEVRPFYLHDRIVEFAVKTPTSYKVPDRWRTKQILRDVAAPFTHRLGLDLILSREKLGMPAAIAKLAKQANDFIEKSISARHINAHPYRQLLKTPLEVLMFDLFYYIFFVHHGKLPDGFQLKEALAGGEFKRMYD